MSLNASAEAGKATTRHRISSLRAQANFHFAKGHLQLRILIVYGRPLNWHQGQDQGNRGQGFNAIPGRNPEFPS